jgi:hypothetical protein
MSGRSTSKKRHRKISFAAFDNDAPITKEAAQGTQGREDAHDVEVGGGVWEGLPYKGQPYSFKNSDPEHMLPQLARTAYVQTFDTTNEKDMLKYAGIMQQCCDGVSHISAEEREYDKDLKGWRIFLRWSDNFYTEPAHLKEKSHVVPKTRTG